MLGLMVCVCDDVVLCLLPLLYTYLFIAPRPLSPFSPPPPSRFSAFLHKRRSRFSLHNRDGSLSSQDARVRSGYEPLGQSDHDDGDSDDEGMGRRGMAGDESASEDGEVRGLRGWEHALFWLPAVCDICGTTVSSSSPCFGGTTIRERKRLLM
jgi:hypothetical protein